MGRFARVAASAVLVALFVCAQASAAYLMPSNGAVRLEPARMFNPNSESLLAFTPVSRAMSPIEIALFNVGSQIEIPLHGEVRAFAFNAPAGSGVASVHLAIPRARASYTSNAALPARAPKLTDVPLSVPPAQTAPIENALAVRIAPPVLTSVQAAPVNFGTYAPYTPSLRGVATDVSAPARVGRMHFETAFHAMQVCGTADEAAACASIRDSAAQSFSAGTSFNVRAGNSAVKVGLSSTIEHMNNATNNVTAGIFPYVPLDPDAQAGLQYFGLTDVVSQGVTAQLAVPVSQRVTVGLQYDRSHLQGDYGTTLLPGFDARKDTYLGNVTYQLPNTSSAITFSARQYRFQDAFAPNFNLTQTRADLNFTVKF
jgi:hypothetical protein